MSSESPVAEGAGGESKASALSAPEASMLRWLERREEELERKAGAATALLMGRQLPQMLTEILAATALPNVITRALLSFVRRAGLNEGVSRERADHLFRKLLDSPLLTSVHAPRDADGTETQTSPPLSCAVEEVRLPLPLLLLARPPKHSY